MSARCVGACHSDVWGGFCCESHFTDGTLTNGEGEWLDRWHTAAGGGLKGTGDCRARDVAHGRTQGCLWSATVLAGPAPGSLTSLLLFTPAMFTPASGPCLLHERPSSELWVATSVTSPTGWPWPSHLCAHPWHHALPPDMSVYSSGGQGRCDQGRGQGVQGAPCSRSWWGCFRSLGVSVPTIFPSLRQIPRRHRPPLGICLVLQLTLSLQGAGRRHLVPVGKAPLL